MPRYFAGIDIGNSHSRILLASEDGTPVARKRLALATSNGFDRVTAAIKQALAGLMHSLDMPQRSLAGAGVGFGGPVEAASGTTLCCPGAPGWEGRPLKTALEHELGVPVVLENDANAGAWGEYTHSYAHRYRHVVYVTVSSGVGGGMIIDSALYRGASGLAGEIGHLALDTEGPLCSCGRRGCLEAFVSGYAIARQAANAGLLEGNHGISAKKLNALAWRGDVAAQDIWEQMGRYLGQGLRGVALLLEPEVIIMGGGVMRARRFFMPRLTEALGQADISRYSKSRVVFA